MGVVVAHVSGIPVEEILLMAIPVAGAAYGGIMATLRVHRRRLLKRK